MRRLKTNIQIYNIWDDKDKCTQALDNVLRQPDLIPASREEALISYALSLSDNNKWYTLTCNNYKSIGKKSAKDSFSISKELETCCFCIDIPSEKFALIDVSKTSFSCWDPMLIGDTDSNNLKFITDKQLEQYISYLTDKDDLEKLRNLIYNTKTSASDALSQMAQLFGFDKKLIICGYQDMCCMNETEVIMLYYKKAGR